MGYNSGIKVFIFLFITKEKPTYCIIFLNNLYLYREFECKKMRFDELDLEDAVLDGLYDMNFDETTPVQELTIPVILEGKDIIACAQTGTGKTAAYVLPVINELSKGCHPTDAVNAVIMAPTRGIGSTNRPTNSRIHLFYTFRIRSSRVWRYRRNRLGTTKERFRDGCGYRDRYPGTFIVPY